MPKGFIEIFREEFRKVNFPIEVKDIRMAEDPLRAVSRGCLNGAIEETQALTDIQKTSDVMNWPSLPVSSIDSRSLQR